MVQSSWGQFVGGCKSRLLALTTYLSLAEVEDVQTRAAEISSCILASDLGSLFIIIVIILFYFSLVYFFIVI